jgi:hypothetical protein
MKAKPNPERKPGNLPAKAALSQSPNEFSRKIAVADLPEAGLDIVISADAEERQRLAELGGLVMVASLAANFHVAKEEMGRVRVQGALHACVTPVCVVSLEPFETNIDTEIDVEFAPVASTVAPSWAQAESAHSAAGLGREADMPDPIIDGQIDLGALAAEFLMLNLDPYPRRPGARFDDHGIAAGESETISPFAVLKRLKERG